MASPYHFHRIESGATDLPPLLFLHGFLGSATDWAGPDGVIEHFHDQFHCIAIDLPGHGRTVVDGSDDYYRMENVTEGLCEVVQSLTGDKCDIVAYSMGGRLALYMAAKYPQFFRRIVLESASPGLENETERHGRLDADRILADRIKREPLEAFLNFWYDQPLFATMKRDSDRLQALMKRRMENNRAELSRALRGLSIGAQPSLWEKLGEIDCLSLLIAGREDAKFVTIAEAMIARGMKAQVTVVEDCGHNVHFERPEQFVREVQRFLTNDSSSLDSDD